MKLSTALLGAMVLSLSAFAQADLTIAGIDTALVITDSQTLRISGVLRATIANAGSAPTAGRFRVIAFEDTNRNGLYNVGVDRILGTAEQVDPIAVGARPVVAIPLSGAVAFRGNLIFVIADSEGVIAEVNKTNNIRSTADSSTSSSPQVFNLADFRPVLKWQWSTSPNQPTATDVITTPVVADINGDGYGDVVFAAAYAPIFSSSTAPGVVRALDGRTGTELFTSAAGVNASSGVAVGDIDGDGRPEVIAIQNPQLWFSQVVAFNNNGTVKWESDPIGLQAIGAPSIADLDGDGSAEIIVGNQVLDKNGRLLWTGTDTSGVNAFGGGGIGPFSVIADVNLDGKLDVVAGRTVYSATGQILYTNPSIPDGFVALANFNSDPYPEIVHVAAGQLRLLTHEMSVIWGPVAIPSAFGSNPTVADFDGDGQPEIAVAGALSISVFKADGTLKWTVPSQDTSSNGNGIAAFDFNGDGAYEIVYRDELAINIYRGTDGATIFRALTSSGTWAEYATVADLDRDGHADIIVPANTGSTGISVFSDPLNSVAAPRIWNQYSYSITNINEDGTVPRYPTPNWLSPGLNNFKANKIPSSTTLAKPDYTSSFIRKNDAAFPSSVQLTARVGNGGGSVTARTCPPNTQAGLTLTAQARDRGFCLSVFADEFPSSSGIGPLGIGFPNSGGVMVSDFPGNVRVFPTLADGQRASSVPAAQSYGSINALDITKSGGKMYMGQEGGYTLVQLNDNGTFNQNVVTNLPINPRGLATNPQSGRIYAGGPGGIVEIDILTRSVALVKSGINFDGISLSSDATILYAASYESGRIYGYSTTNWAQVFDSGVIAGGVDGTAVGAGSLNGKLYVNTNSGTVVEVDLANGSQSLIASGGSRGDFVKVAPDGSLFLTQTDKVYRLTAPAGAGFGTSGPGSVSFYRGDPASGGTLIGRTALTRLLAPGEYEDVSITWNNPPAGLQTIFVVADDPDQILEGNESNNKSATQILLGSGPFPLVDELLTRQKANSVDLSWIAIPGATSYNIYRRTGTGPSQLIRANLAAISFTDTGLANDTPVYYKIRWVNAQGQESADGTEASATPTATGSTGANPPTISSRALTRAVVGQPYSYQFRATDPDAGAVLTYSLIAPPAGMTISTAGLITWTPTDAQVGYSRIQVRVQDNTARFATQTFSLFTEIQTIINNPPVISSTPIRTATSGSLYAYQVVGRDPDGSFLTWSLDAAPLGMSINQATGLIQWTPTRQQVGTQSVTARVVDIGGLSATQAFTISVARGNRGPTFISSALTVARAGELYRYPASATDPEGDPLTYTLVGGPAGMAVEPATGLVTWTPPSNLANTSVAVTLRVVDDGNLAATQAFTVRVLPPNQPPLISSVAVTRAAVGSTYTYQVTGTDPDLPNDRLTFTLTTLPAGMAINSVTGLIQWVPPSNLLDTSQNVTVRVTDLGGLSASQSFAIRVGPAGSDLPFVSLTSPANGANLTEDTPLVGTVTDPNLRLWRIEYQRTGDTEWFPLTSGTTPVTNGSLGTLPATLIANDAYRLRLYAENSAGSITTPDIGANVDTKQLKMGDFTLAFEDLRVPGFTFPISIMRKYDSKRRQSGDFGKGWTLGFSEVDVRLDVNKNVFLTLPDARRVTFNYTPECLGSTQLGFCLFNAYRTVYTGQNGVYDKLETLDCPTTIAGGCGLGDPYNPQSWLLTTRDGVKYSINGGRITRIEDRSGNWMQIESTGVTTNTGRNVVIERNPQGWITKIKEPAPGGEMRYEYDGQGRLVRWINLSAKTTTYFYENAAFPHYLTRITDPLGRNALRNVFNAEGRLVAQCDANGDIATLAGCSRFDPRPGTRTFTAINGRGFKTELVTDDRGNVLTERRFTDATNFLETVRTYDASNNTLTERDPEGNVRTFTYDTRGNRLTETDPGGRTTTYTYAAGCDKVESVTDPAGNVTRNTYDDKCNLRFVTDALLKTTEYRYNSYGQRTQMIDANGTTWTWNYLPNGLLQSVVDPFGKATTFSFDYKGNLLSRTDRNGRRIDFQYDASNRLTRETWDNGRVSTFAYDDLGALLTATDPDSSLTMTYDNLARLQTVDNLGTPGAPRVVMTYSYDANGNTTRVQDSLGGSTDYSYDPLDRLSRVTQSGVGVQPKRVDMTYSPASLLSELKRFSDLAGTQGVANTRYEYECGGCPSRLTAIRHRKASDNSVIHDLTFVRDPLGNIVNSTDAEGAHAYGYDPIRRLTSATHPAGGPQPNEFYTYDAVGNRLTSHLSYFYTYSWQTQGKGNRLLQDNQFDYTYDDEGSLIRKTSRINGAFTEFSYDPRKRPISIIQRAAGGVETARFEYRYDALGRRIGAVENSQTTYWVYDDLNPVIRIKADGTIGSRRLYRRSVDAILADEVGGEPRWFLGDQLDSPRDLVSNVTTNLDHYVFDSYGRVVAGGISDNDIQFTSRESMKALSAAFHRARIYESTNGRFTQEDRLLPSGYLYANGDPLARVDQLGLFDIEYTLQVANVALRTLNAANALVGQATLFVNAHKCLDDKRNSPASCLSELGVLTAGNLILYNEVRSAFSPLFTLALYLQISNGNLSLDYPK